MHLPDADHGAAIAAAFALLQEPPPPFRAELRAEGGAGVLFLLQRAMAPDAAAAQLASEAYDRAWEKLHCGSWKSIHRVWRQAFGVASVLKAQHLAKEKRWIDSLRELDMCLMMAGPNAIRHVHTMIAALEQAIQGSESVGDASPTEGVAKRRRLLSPRSDPIADTGPTLRFPIPRVHLPSLDVFFRQYMLTNAPVILTGAMAQWPAMGLEDPSRAWRQLSYFRRIAGHRTVPIEVGSSYLEDDWSQRLMTVNEFIDRFLEPREAAASDQPIGYLAQHHLFEQIPALRRDIMTPDYCTLQRHEGDDGAEDAEDVTVNAWFGPKSTVSPLHFDPKDNLLCQVVGSKYLRIYAPSESAKLYPVEGLLSNTSQVDVEHPDSTKFPLFQDAPYTECVLQEGEMLYIPPRYWHFVRSLSTSFSVSFWWS